VGTNTQVLRYTTTPVWSSTLPGDVTSVGIQNTDGYIAVTGSPVTTSGTISLTLQTVPVSKGGTGLTSFAEEGALLYGNASGGYTSQNVPPFMRNRVINGDMRIAQRGTAAVTADQAWAVDRWLTRMTVAGASYAAQQSTTAPTGFTNSFGWTTSTGATASASELASFRQGIEGSNVSDLNFGTPEAKTITLSFWVRASIAGTYCVMVQNGAPFDRRYIAEYTVSNPNTWQKVSLTIPGCTDGTWLKDANLGLYVVFDLGSGSDENTTPSAWVTTGRRTTAQTNLIGTTGATFYLTGVQLELGTVATPYEPRPIQAELALCQRYYARLQSLSGTAVGFGAGMCTTASVGGNAPSTHSVYVKYPVTMRTYPTMAISGCSMRNSFNRPATLGAVQYGLDSCQATISASGTTTATFGGGQGTILTGNASTAYVEFNAEL
jgi:hypothetical protein